MSSLLHQLSSHLSISVNMSSEPVIHNIFEPVTCTWQYIVADPFTSEAVIIDSVLDFDPNKLTVSTSSADAVLALIAKNGYHIDKVLETHVHADHLTAAKYIQHKLVRMQGSKPDICIGQRVTLAQETFAKRYGVPKEEIDNAFDRLFDDTVVFKLGGLEVKVLHLPGHTHDHLGYQIGCRCPFPFSPSSPGNILTFLPSKHLLRRLPLQR